MSKVPPAVRQDLGTFCGGRFRSVRTAAQVDGRWVYAWFIEDLTQPDEHEPELAEIVAMSLQDLADAKAQALRVTGQSE